MPPKKPIHRNNKKKKGKNGSHTAPLRERSVNSNAPSEAIPNPPSSSSSSSLPSSTASATTTTSAVGSIYGAYKIATKSFKDGLMSLVPTSIFSQDRVQNIVEAVDYIVEHKIAVSALLLEDCWTSLSFRKQYSKKLGDGSDDGHEYFILVLHYCYSSLKQRVSKVQRKAANEQAKQSPYYEQLYQSDSEDDDEDEDSQETTTVSRRPERPREPPNKFTFDDLLQATDRLQSCGFLDSVEEAMKEVAFAYKSLKTKMRQVNVEEAGDADYLIGELIETGVTTVFGIREVQLMEAELQIDHPHLSTFYRVLGCVFLVHEIDELNSYAQEAGANVPRTELTAFIGDVVEYGFRNAKINSNRKARVGGLVASFCRKWSLPRDKVKTLVDKTLSLILMEIRFDSDAMQIPSNIRLAGASPHSWMQKYTYIGGARNILNTHRLVQGLSSHLMRQPPTKLISVPNYFGTLWDENNLAKTIQRDMDQLVMSEILPDLLTNCQEGVLSKLVERGDEIPPFFMSLMQYTTNPEKPVPLSLSFGVHAILTSIYELQGQNDVAIIGEAAKITYYDFVGQLTNQRESELPCSRIWKRINHLLGIMSMVRCNRECEQANTSSMWNPCCAGMVLMYVCYHINMEGGSGLIDSHAQLRMVLYLYNGLKQRNLISEDIPLLASLDKLFDGVRSVWVGEKPNREQLVKTFLLAAGVSLSESHEDVFSKKLRKTWRKKTPCKPEDISKSYRQICQNDFSGMVDRYYQNHDLTALSPQYSFCLRLKDTLDLMASEDELLSWNLTAVGGCLNEFICVLVDQLDWKERIASDVKEKLGMVGHPEADRFMLYMRFANELLGPLERVDSVEHHPVLTATRDCMIEFFSELLVDHWQYQYFGSEGARDPNL